VDELERDNGMVQNEELVASAVYPKGPNPSADAMIAPAAPLVQTLDDAAVRIKHFSAVSARLTTLQETLEGARDDQYREERALHGAAEEAFTAAGFLAADAEVKEVELMRRIPSEHRDGGREGKQLDDLQPQNDVDPPEAAQPPKDMNAELQDMLKTHLASQVKKVWNKLMDSERRLHKARSGPLLNAGTLDSDARGAVRVRRMIQLTREVRGNQDGYRLVIRNALKSGAISESYRRENFEDHASDGYSDTSLEMQGWPMREKKTERVEK
jgi:hypothetical protein